MMGSGKGRNIYTMAFKRLVVREVEDGQIIASVAGRHGLNPQAVGKWVKKAKLDRDAWQKAPEKAKRITTSKKSLSSRIQRANEDAVWLRKELEKRKKNSNSPRFRTRS